MPGLEVLVSGVGLLGAGWLITLVNGDGIRTWAWRTLSAPMRDPRHLSEKIG